MIRVEVKVSKNSLNYLCLGGPFDSKYLWWDVDKDLTITSNSYRSYIFTWADWVVGILIEDSLVPEVNMRLDQGEPLHRILGVTDEELLGTV